jgi:hypothetical protein
LRACVKRGPGFGERRLYERTADCNAGAVQEIPPRDIAVHAKLPVTMLHCRSLVFF